MHKIQLLDQNTINKIAAGEVVERPSSVVKELVENAIDAGATAVTVEIKEGGLSMIRITDNGSGIDPEDIRDAFLRHSTSKIRDIDDLTTIASLGFRGEALASIAAVAQVEMMTKTHGQLTGTRYVVEGGFEKGFDEIGCPEGTTLIINQIFFNTPARRKFLKTPVTESAYVSELMGKMALGNPHVSFKFINNGQVKLHTSGNNKLMDCIFTVFGKEIAKNLIELSDDSGKISLSGYIGKPVISRANRNYENYYINGRYIKSKVVQKAIEDAYKSKLTLHQYPFTCFYLTLDPESVDVNVHPTKMEVRFNDEKGVYDQIFGAIHRALNETDLIPRVSFEQKKLVEMQPIAQNVPEPFETRRREQMGMVREARHPFAGKPVMPQTQGWPAMQGTKETLGRPEILNRPDTHSRPDIQGTTEIQYGQESQRRPETRDNPTTASPVPTGNDYNKASDLPKVQSVMPETAGITAQSHSPAINTAAPTPEILTAPIIKGDQIDLVETGFVTKAAAKSHHIVGQLFGTYWIVEFKDLYYIIDQHAAHERVLYDRILSGLKTQKTYKQELLHPLVVQLNAKERIRLDAHQVLFRELGFEIEDFGGDDIAIRTVPLIFEKPLQPEDFVKILDRLDESYQSEKHEILLEEIASMSCKAAVKAHDKMSVVEYHKLMDELLELENPFNCPHGRPTIISMTRYELEKKFKRIQ